MGLSDGRDGVLSYDCQGIALVKRAIEVKSQQ